MEASAVVSWVWIENNGQGTYYGHTVSVSLGAAANVLPSNPHDIAVAHHMSFSLAASTQEIECWNNELRCK